MNAEVFLDTNVLVYAAIGTGKDEDKYTQACASLIRLRAAEEIQQKPDYLRVDRPPMGRSLEGGTIPFSRM